MIGTIFWNNNSEKVKKNWNSRVSILTIRLCNRGFSGHKLITARDLN